MYLGLVRVKHSRIQTIKRRTHFA